ncbi:hypothetical protein A8B83_11285 [Rhodobacteraceae bacterium EhC02]|nr:hypothetical protein A8B83_11285 [Rhodobacteraceae bacterium EhC02]
MHCLPIFGSLTTIQLRELVIGSGLTARVSLLAKQILTTLFLGAATKPDQYLQRRVKGSFLMYYMHFGMLSQI